MKFTADQLLTIANKFEAMASDLVKTAKKDPKAKVRNRGKVVFPAGSSSVKDKKDHFHPSIEVTKASKTPGKS